MVNVPVRLVIWDWNGTLLDDTEICWRIANEMRAERGLPALDSVESYRRVFGFPVIDYYRRMGYTFENETYEDVSHEFVKLYAEHVAACPLQPGVRETLAAIRKRGVTQVLLSATGAERLLEQLALFGLSDSFDRVIGTRNDLAHGKADYAGALLREGGFAPNCTLFVGDTDHDFEIAESLGCRCALLLGGHQTRAHLTALGAPLIDSPAGVLNLL